MEPLLRWPGGKTRLLGELRAKMPSSRSRYYEPFLGGGALFFGLEERGAVISDLSTWLTDTYAAVAHDLTGVIDRLREHRDAYSRPEQKGYYYEVRDRFNAGGGSETDRAADFIFLNRTCYNGLVRSNKAGKFNVPEGDVRRPRILDESLLTRASVVLRSAELRRGSYDVTTTDAGPGDFLYLDPPYDPISATSNFTSYTSAGFGPDAQEALACYARWLSDRGCRVMISNNDTPRIRTLYEGWEIDAVACPRFINSRGDRRGAISEVIVRNYR